jgi:hypothetical protein
MPQQFVNLNYPEMIQPITNSIRSGLTSLADTGAAIYQKNEQNKINDEKNQQAFNELYSFYSPVPGLKFDWNSIKPTTGENHNEYIARVQKSTVGIYPQLERLGIDLNELATAAKIPDANNELFQKVLNKQLSMATMKRLQEGGDIEGARKAVMEGKLSPNDIGGKYGVNMDQPTYEKIAGFAENPTSPMGGAGSMPPPIKDQRPLTREETLPLVAKPVSYQAGQEMVNKLNIPEADKGVFTPILNRLNNQEAGKIAESSKSGQEFWTGVAKGGNDVTEVTKQLGTSIANQDKLDAKEQYNKMRQGEQWVSYLKVMMQDKQFRDKLRKDYGESAEKAADKMSELLLEEQNIQLEIEKSNNWTDWKNPAPDVPTLRTKQMHIRNRIDDLRSVIPGLKSEQEYLEAGPTAITPPKVGPGIVPDGGKSNNYRDKAIMALLASGVKAPNEAQIQRMIVAAQNKATAQQKTQK